MRNVQALGRLKPGQMNRTEARYAAHLEALKRAGDVAWFEFEAAKFRIAQDRCWYTPDFMVLRRDGRLELHEVKGAAAVFTDDAKVKVKVVADRFPFPVFVAFPDKSAAGGWRLEEY